MFHNYGQIRDTRGFPFCPACSCTIWRGLSTSIQTLYKVTNFLVAAYQCDRALRSVAVTEKVTNAENWKRKVVTSSHFLASVALPPEPASDSSPERSGSFNQSAPIVAGSVDHELLYLGHSVNLLTVLDEVTLLPVSIPFLFTFHCLIHMHRIISYFAIFLSASTRGRKLIISRLADFIISYFNAIMTPLDKQSFARDNDCRKECLLRGNLNGFEK